MSEPEPMQFDSKAQAESWLCETGNWGLVHPSLTTFIIVQFTPGAVWAFAASDLMVQLPDW
jgi:hypothetical protein